MASTPHPTYFPRRLARRLLPRSLTGRVYALYSITLVAFVGLGLALFLLHYFKQEIEDTQQASVMLVEVVAQAVQDSAVIGDYDTLRKTLEKTVNGPLYASATFMDVGGGRVHVENRMVGQTEPPQWLLRWANNRLYDVNHTVSVGGKDYGVLRLQFDVAHVAEDLWLVSRVAVGLGLLSLLTGLLVIRFPLLRWLGSMEQLRHLLSRLGNSDFDANRIDLQDAPSEVRRVVEMVEQTATLLREREASRRALDERNYAMDQHAIVSVTDLQGSILYANDRFSAISGYSSEELMGKNHRIIKSGLHDPAFYVDLWQT
ncbi:MAG: PAS domain S-box protein, partial [Rhodoferax sp.]